MAARLTKEDLQQFARGLLMGGADIVPGVSGGTVALVLGIYQRLVEALSRFDRKLIAAIVERDLRAAAEHVDLRFLFALGAGIAVGVAGLARVMHYLLESHPQPTWSFFFGLILGSGLVVARMIPTWNFRLLLAAAGGTAFSFWLMGQLPAIPPAGTWYLFVCGLLGSCAMILPGISGAFIVLILGKYLAVTGAVKDLARLHFSSQAWIIAVTFGAGYVVGILAFSKVLRRLFESYERLTLAVLCGFMLGSLRRIWPFKREATPDDFPGGLERVGLNEEKLSQITFNEWPANLDSSVALCLTLAAVGFAAVVAMDYTTRDHEQNSDSP